MITETKRKRGRPPYFSAEEYQGLDSLVGDTVTTKRGLRNVAYMTRGFGLLKAMVDRGVTGLDFLIDPKRRRMYSQGILREIGLIEDKEHAERVALFICQIQSQTHWPRYRYERTLRVCRLNGLTDMVIPLIRETISENQEVPA